MTALRGVLARYAALSGLVRRGWHDYPVDVVPFAADLADVLVVQEATGPGGRLAVDPQLAALGAQHLAALRAATPGLFDGTVLCFTGIEDDGLDGVRLRVAPGGYFDMLTTCDALRAGGDAAFAARSRAHQVCGDPLSSGTGRAAGVGVSVLLTAHERAPGGSRPGVILGRRAAGLATDPGLWHVAPSGMLEPAPNGDHLAVTVVIELAEELGVAVQPQEVHERSQVLGLAHDLGRLRPDLVVVLDLDVDVADLRHGGEFDEVKLVALHHDGRVPDVFWAEHPPASITPAAAGALALLDSQAAELHA